MFVDETLTSKYGLKMPIHAPEIGVLGDLIPTWEQYQRDPKTHACLIPCSLSHHKWLFVKVWPAEVFQKKL